MKLKKTISKHPSIWQNFVYLKKKKLKYSSFILQFYTLQKLRVPSTIIFILYIELGGTWGVARSPRNLQPKTDSEPGHKILLKLGRRMASVCVYPTETTLRLIRDKLHSAWL